MGTYPSITSEWLCADHVGTHPTITSEYLYTDHVVTQPTITSEHLYTYIWSCGNISLNHIRMALHWSCGNTSHNHIRMYLHLHMTMWSLAFHHVKREQHLDLTMEGTNPLTMLEGNSNYIWPWKEPILSPCQKGSQNHHFPLEGTSIWRTPSFCSEVLKLHYGHF